MERQGRMTSFTTSLSVSSAIVSTSLSLFFVTNFSVSSHQKVGKTKTAPTVAASAMRINDQDQKGTWGWLVRGDTEVVIVKDTSNKAKSSAEKCILASSFLLNYTTYMNTSKAKPVKTPQLQKPEQT